MKFRKRPVVIEAVQFTGGNQGECSVFCPLITWPPDQDDPVNINENLIIPTLEGNMICSVGDWIIKGVNGEFYPCKPDIFKKTYEPVDDIPLDKE